MERTVFDLMQYPVRVGRETRHAFTLSGEVRGAVPVGRVTAPPGTEVWALGGPAKLKVPRPGRPGEFDVLSAAEVHEKARAGAMGLALEAEKETR